MRTTHHHGGRGDRVLSSVPPSPPWWRASWTIICLMLSVAAVTAQQAPTSKSDPRIGLKPGLHDAGEAAFNMERMSSLPKPDGFFDPKAPAGNPAPPERDPNAPRDPNRPAPDP